MFTKSTDIVLEARGAFLHSCRHASEATGSLGMELVLWLTPLILELPQDNQRKPGLQIKEGYESSDSDVH